MSGTILLGSISFHILKSVWGKLLYFLPLIFSQRSTRDCAASRLNEEHLNSSTSCSVLHLYDSATCRRNQTCLTQAFICFLRLQSIQRQAVQGQCCGFQNTPFAVLLCHPWSLDTEWLQSFRALCLPSRLEERMSTKPINIYLRKIASLPVQASHLLLKSHVIPIKCFVCCLFEGERILLPNTIGVLASRTEMESSYSQRTSSFSTCMPTDTLKPVSPEKCIYFLSSEETEFVIFSNQNNSDFGKYSDESSPAHALSCERKIRIVASAEGMEFP